MTRSLAFASRTRRDGTVVRLRGGDCARPPAAVDPRAVGGRQPANDLPFRPLRARDQWRDLQPPRDSRGARARGRRACLARSFGHGVAARRLRSLGCRRTPCASPSACSRWPSGTARSAALTFARDRLGEKPLYYGVQGDVLLFGSELKSLRGHAAFRAEVDREQLGVYLHRGYVPAPMSIYLGIRKLPPGCFVRFGPDALPGQPAGTGGLLVARRRRGTRDAESFRRQR